MVWNRFSLGFLVILGSLVTVACSEPNAITPSAKSEPNLTGTLAKQPQYRLVSLVQGLENPWGMAWLPNGTILITERSGQLRQVRNGRLESRAIPGVPRVFASGQGGLLDITPHPRFAENKLVYFSYADGNRNGNRTKIARAIFDGEAIQNWQVIFEVTPAKPGSQHFGSRLVWLPDETLLVSIGDGGNPPVSLDGELIRLQAQNLDSHLGKVIRIGDDGSIPENNPSLEGNKSAIWSYGHRNIQGLAYDAITNRIWATEHGARGGDELNLLQIGKNYGWPLVSNSREYRTGKPIGTSQSQPAMVDPKIVWTPAIAPSGLAVYNGEIFPQWQGNLFAGGLVSKDLRRLETDASGNVVEVERINIGQRVRDIRQGSDGLLYLLTDEFNGQLMRIEPVQ